MEKTYALTDITSRDNLAKLMSANYFGSGPDSCAEFVQERWVEQMELLVEDSEIDQDEYETLSAEAIEFATNEYNRCKAEAQETNP